MHTSSDSSPQQNSQSDIFFQIGSHSADASVRFIFPGQEDSGPHADMLGGLPRRLIVYHVHCARSGDRCEYDNEMR